ncbi:MAG: glutamyl-tRNA reductase [Dehalococcoidia bacterium]
MNLLVVGLNHRTAPVEVRERLAVTRDQLPDALGHLKRVLSQGLILSTCNRAEFYTLSQDHTSEARLKEFVSGYFHVSLAGLAGHLYSYAHQECVHHLFRVASGLDSMILGESQILGQVRDAFAAATKAKTVGGPLSRLFHQAIRVGKRARRETRIGHNALSVSRACVELARHNLGDLSTKRVLVIGIGDAGKLAARALRDDGVGQVVVTNRTYARAVELAWELDGSALPFEVLPAALAESDIVISSTDSPEHLLTLELVGRAMEGRGDRLLFLMDIAVPRDIDPTVREVPGVVLYDIDDLEAVSQANKAERLREAGKAEALVHQEVQQFMEWWRSLDVVPTIAALREWAESMRLRELKKTLKRLPDLSPQERERLDSLTRAIVKKLLHQPIADLRERKDPGRAQLVQELFRFQEREG